MAGEKKIAVLACSYNRIAKTTAFIKSLVLQPVPDDYKLDIYLLDDKSPDGTGEYIKSHFPQVNVIEGSGSLFWAGGMRRLWESVKAKFEYDLYLLMNDDVQLFDGVLGNLLNAYERSDGNETILVGTVLDRDSNAISYGGRKIVNKINGGAVNVEPDETALLPCDLGHANIMLVNKATVDKIGILSDKYIHSFADWDYTLTATRAGVKVYVAPGYYGYCKNDHGVPWLSGAPLKKRIEFLYSPKGLELKSFMKFMSRNFPYYKPVVFTQMWLRTLLPGVYDKFKK